MIERHNEMKNRNNAGACGAATVETDRGAALRHGGKERGMNLGSKFKKGTVFIFALAAFMLQGWFAAGDAQAAITYFGSNANPVDGATATNVANPTAVTPPALMQTGDLVLLYAFGIGTTDPVINQAGGQTWNALTVRTTAGGRDGRTFWARFNGTWSANPSVTMPGVLCNSVVMHVFRPTDTTNTWAVDVAEVNGTFTNASATVTIPGITTLTDGAVVIATWASDDDNTWGTLTSGWSVPGSAQYRNVSGTDLSHTFAYEIMATAGATGDVAKTQTALGPDAGVRSIIAFKELHNLNIGNGTNPATGNVARSTTNNALDSFTLQATTDSAVTVTSLTVLGSVNFTATNVPTNGVKIWRDAGTIGTWDAADTLISSGSTAIAGNSTTVTLTAAETVTPTAANYLVTVDITAGATNAQGFTGTITNAVGGTNLGTINDNDTTSATLTVTTTLTTTIGLGTNPANVAAYKGATDNAINGFTLTSNLVSGASVTSVTVLGTSANFNTTNIPTNGVKIWRDAGTIGALDGGDVLISSGSTAIAGNSTTVTLAAAEALTNTAINYLITIDINVGATAGNTISATVTNALVGSNLGTVTDNDTTGATLTVTASILTIGTGTNPVTGNVARSTTNNAIDGFTLQVNGGSSTVTSLTVLGTSATFNTTNIPTNGVKIWRDAGTIGTLDAADTLISSGSTAIAAQLTTVTLAAAETVTTTAANYLVTIDITAGAVNANAISATLNATVGGTNNGTPLDNDTTAATLTVTTTLTTTIGLGTNPANVAAYKGATDNAINGFTLTSNLVSGASVTSVTVLGTSATFNTTNIPTNGVKIWRDAGTIGTLDGGDVLISSGSTAIAGNSTTVTLAAAEALTSTAINYLVTVDINLVATAGNTISATVTNALVGSNLGTVTDNDTTGATLTVTASILTIGTGTDPANSSPSVNSSNNAIDGFTLQVNGGSGLVTSLTVLGTSANFNATNIPTNGVKIWRDAGTIGTWDAGDSLISSGSTAIAAQSTTVTLALAETVTTTLANYLVTIDIAAGATVGNTISATLTNTVVGTNLGTPADNDTTAATLTVASIPATTTGAMYFSDVTANSITVTVTYTRDDNTNNSMTLAYGTAGVTGPWPNSVTVSPSGKSWVGTATGLSEATVYYFRATFSDGDGVNGTNPIDGSQRSRSISLVHQGAVVGPKYASGTWGGTFDCATCHQANATNIKRLRSTVGGSGLTNSSGGNISGLPMAAIDARGSEADGYASIGSGNKVCEVCHGSTTVFRSGVGDTVSGNILSNGTPPHPNDLDCIKCHLHSEGFKVSARCIDCHSVGGTYRANTGASPIVDTTGAVLRQETYGGHLRLKVGENLAAVTDWDTRCLACHDGHVKNQDGGVHILNNPTVGIDYQRGYIVLGGSATSGSTEAEICWNCHDVVGVSEWGDNTDTNGNLNNYNFGTVYTSAAKTTTTSRWIGSYWTSANFSYKEGWLNNKPNTTSAVNGTVNGGSTHAAATGTKGIDAVASIRCSYCHDVHNTAALTAGFLGAANDPNGKPYLRGRWVGSPYREDGAPRTENNNTTAARPYPGTAVWGQVPRGTNTYTTLGGYQIDQNNGNPIAPTYTATQFGGLCDLCHSATKDGAFTAGEIDALNQYDAAGAGWVSALNGHSNSVHGGTDSTVAARNIFAGRGGATAQIGEDAGGVTDEANFNHPFMGFFGTSVPGDKSGGFRGSAGVYKFTPAMVGAQGRPMDGEGWVSTGWNNIAGRTLDWDGSTVDAGFHSFSCSKCHTPHASRLPALMISNCLDTKNNTWDNDYQVNSTTDAINAGRSISNWSSAQNCHRLRGDDPSDTRDTAAQDLPGNRGWNTVTPW